ncbi:galectin-2-like [Dasypus novemcinctus]|uniref:galectin-2-like n=1 Tax=Dasypus novemcinctus TaxID=9361 RepID=UPI0039C975AB
MSVRSPGHTAHFPPLIHAIAWPLVAACLRNVDLCIPTAAFAINLGRGRDKLGLTLSPHLDESSIVCTSWDGTWGPENVEKHMPLRPGSEFTLTVAFESEGFKVTLPDGYQFSFPNRLGLCQLPYLSVEGGGRGGFSISSLKFD